MSGRGGRGGRGGGGGDFGGGRGGGRMTAGQRPVTEGTRIHIDVQLERFKASDETEIVFPPDMSNHDRAVVHACCKKLGLKSKSHGKGEARRVHVTKPKEYKPQDHEDLHDLKLHPGSLEALSSHFQTFPQTSRELEIAAAGSLEDAWDEVDGVDGSDARGMNGQGGPHTTTTTGRKGKRPRGPPPLLMRPFANVAPHEASRRAEAFRARVACDASLAAIQRQREALPVRAFRDSLLEATRTNQVVLVAGATGCGKTTQVPQYLIDDAWSNGRGAAIMCTQPRRISAITVSERVAAERGEVIGVGAVGYQIRLESKASSECSLLFCTNGVLLRRLTSPGADAMLAATSHIVVDEIHERDLFADFLAVVLRSALQRHPHLRLVLMSATVREDLFSEYFNKCPVIRVPGRTHPVADYHLEDILANVGYGGAGAGAATRRAPTADPDSPEGSAVQAATMRAFLEGTDESFDELMSTITNGRLNGGFADEQALAGVAHAGTGATPLMAAAGKGRHVEVSRLLGCGADPCATSRDGGTAADWARRFGHEDIALTLDAAREELARIASTEHSAVSLSAYQLAADPDEVDLDLTAALLHWIVATRAEEVKRESGGVGPDGAVLVFLPGWHEISQLRDMLEADPRFGKDVLVLPLHSMVPPAEQKRVFKRPPAGVKKIVLATNIAETAVTIDDVVFVVDSGRLKEKSYDPHTGVSTLQAAWISRASAQQRRGRAGRVRPGECYRLYSSARMASFADFQLPEMQRSPLEELCLQVRMLAEASSLGGDRGGAAAAVGTGEGSTAAFLALAPEPPVPRAIEHAVTLLQNIGALKEDESLTRLGRHLGEMPVHPRVGKMLLYATLLGVLDPVLTVACAAAYRSPFVVSTDGGREAGKAARRAFSDEAGGGSDHLAVSRAYVGWELSRSEGGNGGERRFTQRHCLSGATLNMLKGMRQQLITALTNRGLIASIHQASKNADAGALVRAVLAVGMYPLIGRLLVPQQGGAFGQQSAGGGQKATLATLRGEKVKIHPHSVNCKAHAFANDERDGPTLVCYDDITRGESQMYVRECTTVAAPALVLVTGNLAVEPLPPCSMPDHDESDPVAVREAEETRRDAQAAQDASQCAVLVCDDWLRFRVPLTVLSQIACLRIRLAKAFAAKTQRPHEALAPDLADALGAVATVLAHDGGAAAAGDRAGAALGAGGYGAAYGGGFASRNGGANNMRDGDWQCPRGCGVVFASKPACFRCGLPKGAAAPGGRGGGRGRGGGARGGGRGRGVPTARSRGWSSGGGGGAARDDRYR